ncbi:hypothetical protein A3D78_07090 [Candidatus Gottesmanbacteria bacterium RIFCSPHIGHO2_02_FULL_39_14]|uniref:Peptidase S8/S53 domain-containing protein n=1 Tax=Candidatus Gottesmanbacteria bacterium RIFCSPHIGHO2_02_FULL_39_14 TaxID=1798383 RepID=A0A1F5ZXP4_9BACT|nr:MAG: hypothetical protein A3D78_07090 [Candidatus Gottesmanbacteria bacterium RIFCSPHIGHO2_02_FULL_39_14]
MKINKIIFLLLILFLLTSLPIISGRQIKAQNQNPTARIIVRFAPQVNNFEKFNIRRLIGAILADSIDRLNAQVLEVPFPFVQSALEILKKQNQVLYVEEDHLAYVLEMTDDPYLGNQWGLVKIQAAAPGESAWNYNHGSSQVLISIVDTGIDQNHPDLIGKIAKNKNCTSSKTIDDKYAHGTHVAGISSAITNNGVGVAGTSYNVRLLNAKGLGDNGSGYYSWIANCIIWSADNGASVINLSLGGSSSSQTLADSVNYAWNKGVVVVAAAGNSGSSSPSYPAYYANSVAVAATDENDQKAGWSNYGSWVDLAAPGVSIYSTAPNHTNSLKIYNYAFLSGTSMATPFVSGLAALLKSAGNLNNQEIIDNLYNNADKISQTGNYWQYGRINALNSLKEVFAFTPISTPTQMPTDTPTPILTPSLTPSPTPTLTSTYTPTPTPSNPPTGGPTPTPWWCRWTSRCR